MILLFILNDFLLLQFYLFGNLKGKVYQNNIPTSLALQNELIHVIALVIEDNLEYVTESM
jgi:hypothetical protein